MAEVSYYSYEYDPDSEAFIADADGGDRFDFPDGGGDIATDIQLPVLDTKNTPERWYDPLASKYMVLIVAFSPFISVDQRWSMALIVNVAFQG